MLRQGKAKTQPLLSEVNRTKEVLVDMSKMIALQLEGTVVTPENASKDALFTAIGRTLQFTHALLQLRVAAGKAIQDGRGIVRTTCNVVASTIWVDDSNFDRVRSFVRNVCVRLRNSQS